MRILLAAKFITGSRRPIGGVQSWCDTVGDELKNRGHTVVQWCPGHPVPLGGFDFGIVSHTTDTARARNWCVKSIVVCHGIIPAETPPGSSVVFTSEEVRDHWGGDGPIIRQPIDTEFWSPRANQNIYLLRFSYRDGLPFIVPMAKSLGYEYHHLQIADMQMARDAIRQSVCVLATGRSSLEAMSCGVPVVLCDHRIGYMEPLMDLDIKDSMTRNYSGRGGVTPTPDNVEEAIKVARDIGSMREHILKNHNVKDIVDQLLEVP